MLGKPVIRGTHIPVELILRKISEGATEADLLVLTRVLQPKISEGRHRLCSRHTSARRDNIDGRSRQGRTRMINAITVGHFFIKS